MPADIVAFSLEPDITRLVRAGIVAEDWNAGETKGIVHESVVVFGVRNGNPKNIRTWADLIEPGVEVVTPNPFTSGGARWNVMAAWAQAVEGKDDAAGLEYSMRSSATSRSRTTLRASRCRHSRPARVTCCLPTRTR